jgi:DNA replication protein DnaC
MMNNELLQQALGERRAAQAFNEQEERHRLAEVSAACPVIAELINQRRQAIMDGLHLAMQGTAPVGIEEATCERNRRIQELLKRSGFADDYLSPIYSCPLCRDTGYAGQSKKTLCRCVALRYQELINGSSFTSENQTFENYDELVFPLSPLEGTQTTQRAYTRYLCRECETWADSLPHGTRFGLLLHGKSGLGKTYLLRAIGARAREHGIETLALTANTLLNQIRKQYFSREDNADAAYMDVPLLMIDDLGTEPLWENITVEQLFSLLEHRLTGSLHTVISTNLSLSELKSRYTERIVSRLMDERLCLRLPFLGQDVRLRTQDSHRP